MKWILGAILIILAICFAGMLLPAIIGIAAGIALIKSGSIIGGLIAIIAGIGINAAMLYGGYAEGSFIKCRDADGSKAYLRSVDRGTMDGWICLRGKKDKCSIKHVGISFHGN